MYKAVRCTCVICGTRFTTLDAYDVCSTTCEDARLDRPYPRNYYDPVRDNGEVRPIVVEITVDQKLALAMQD